MITSIKELRERFEALSEDFATGRITSQEYLNALIELQKQADAGRIPFVFSPSKKWFSGITDSDLTAEVPANDDGEPYFVTLEELDEEPSEDEESSSSKDYEWNGEWNDDELPKDEDAT